MTYGHQLACAMKRAAQITTATDVTVDQRRAEVIDLALAGITVPQLRALWVAHFSGQPLPRGMRRADVVAKVHAAAMARMPSLPVWVVCHDYVAGPYKTPEAAQRDLERFDCPGEHEVVVAATKPVSAYQRWRDSLDDQDD
jgi:hypothetical protein